MAVRGILIRRPSFANSLVVRTALLIVLALSLFAAGTYHFVVRPALRSLAQAQMGLVSQQLEARVALLLGTVETTLRSSRGWGINGDLDQDELLRFNQFFFPILANHSEISSVNFAHESGREILLLLNDDGTWVNRLSNPEAWGRRTYWLFWDKARKLQRVEVRLLDYDTRKRPWFQGAMALANDSDIHWTEPYIFFTTKDPGITASMRWTGRDGSRYVIGHDVRLLELSAFTAQLAVGNAGKVALMQPDGRLVALPRDERFTAPDGIRQAILKRPAELGLEEIGAALARRAETPDRSLYEYDARGMRWLSLLGPMAAGDQHFLLGVFAPESEFIPATPANLAFLAGVALFSLLAGTVVAFRVARQFGRPLATLVGESARIGRLELDAPVDVPGPWREVRELAAAQESMRLRLRDANAALEATVAERTRELRESQRALQEREAHFRAIFENAAIGISNLTPQLKRRAVNRAFAEFTGYSEAELLSGTALDLVIDVDRERIRLAYQELAAGRQPSFRTETRFVRPDGSLRWADVQLTAIRDADGSIASLLATILDITDRRNMEDELERQFALLQALLNTIPNPIFYKGPDTRFLGCNRAYEEAFGISRHQFIGRRVLDLDYLPEADRLAYQAEDEGVIASAGCVAREVRMRLADGDEHDTLYSVTGFRNPDGTPGGLVGLIVDITPLKRAEREAHQARAAAESAAAAKADFLSNMSHEIRTPMNAIVGMTHLALQTALSPQQRNYVEKIDAATRSLLAIVNDILDFSKIEAGMMTVEAADFSLSRTLRRLADLTSQKATDKKLELAFEVAPEVPDGLNGDALRLGQVLLNLVGNALKFTERGRVTVAVGVASSSDPLRLRFEVRDTGIGMSEDQQRRLFAPFTQADTSTTRKYGGTGLGLSICKRLVALMGGEIGVSSVPGEGSRFHFSLPFGRSASAVPVEEAPAASGVPAVLRGHRVLLVEDNEVSRELAEEILHAAGLEVDTACDGAQAVERGRTGRYDAILMDCHMPVMDGFEATRRLRADPLTATVPVLAMTASVLLADRELCLAAGMNDHISKPVDVGELYGKLAAYLGGIPAAPAVAAPPKPVLDELPLDRAAALARLNGDEMMYGRLLARFAENQRDAVAAIRSAMAAGDAATAKRLAHTLKGLAGNVGAMRLANSAADAEAAVAAGSDGGSALDALAAALGEVLAIIGDEPGTVLVRDDRASSAEEFQIAVAQLVRLLDGDDAEAVHFLEVQRPLLASHLPADAFARLDQLVGRYCFEEAVELLNATLAQAMGGKAS
ncbi:MAG TPA: PAS domain S-box protein [Rhodocyclaceae bacterium]